ncbi:hypothetical protein H0H93_000369 [Arthromyces matolae]|nr:hypothetical protein H0H93_000369 [Arthromyces matolae]
MALTPTEAHTIARTSRRVLLLLDIQNAMLLPPPVGVPSSEAITKNISKILTTARAASPPPLIIHVQNCGDAGDPDEPGSSGWELIFDIPSGAEEFILDKRKNNAFAGTCLDEIIPIDAEVIVVGFQTDHSVRATCHEALKRGNEVLLVRGAHGTYDRIEVLHGGGGGGINNYITPAKRIETEVEFELDEAGVHVLDMRDVCGIFVNR